MTCGNPFPYIVLKRKKRNSFVDSICHDLQFEFSFFLFYFGLSVKFLLLFPVFAAFLSLLMTCVFYLC